MGRLLLVLIVIAAGGCKKKVKPPPETTVVVAADAAIDAVPVPTLAEVLPAYVAVAELYARIVEAMEDDYPGVPEDRRLKAKWTANLPTFKFYIGASTSIEAIRAMAAARSEPLDRAVVAYLDHVTKGWGRIDDLQLYMKREDYLDDQWARLLAEEPAVKAWFAEASRLAAEVRTGLAAAWPRVIGDAQAASNPALAAWEACGPILRIVMADDADEDDAIKGHVDACRPKASALGGNAGEALHRACDSANFWRRAAGEREHLRRTAISDGIYAHQQLLSAWIGSDEVLPPPNDWIY